MIAIRRVILRPDLAEGFIRGVAYHQLGMHEQGLHDRSEAIRLNPQPAGSLVSRGSAYNLMGDFQKAYKDLQHAVSLRPGYQEAIDVLKKPSETAGSGGRENRKPHQRRLQRNWRRSNLRRSSQRK